MLKPTVGIELEALSADDFSQHFEYSTYSMVNSPPCWVELADVHNVCHVLKWNLPLTLSAAKSCQHSGVRSW
jgi:hypothetical protein